MKSAEELPLADYERTDASPLAISLIAISLVAALAAVLAVSARVYRQRYENSPTASTNPVQMSFRHGSLEQTGIARDWEDQDRIVREHLTTYGWIDRRAGVVHIPIERAVELLATDSANNTGHKNGTPP